MAFISSRTFSRDGLVMGEEVQQAERVVEMILMDPLALRAVGIRPLELAAEMSEGKDGGLLVVQFEFSVPARVEIDDFPEPERSALRGLVTQPIREQRVTRGVVFPGRGDRHLQFGILGHGQAEVVIHRRGMRVTLIQVPCPGADAWQQPAPGIHRSGPARSLVEADAGRFLAEFRP
jgi:hypothetical protein